MLPFFESLRWRGPAEVELKIDARDGEAKVIEVNPRLPGYVGFPIAWVHLPRSRLQVALGETPTLRAMWSDAASPPRPMLKG